MIGMQKTWGTESTIVDDGLDETLLEETEKTEEITQSSV